MPRPSQHIGCMSQNGGRSLVSAVKSPTRALAVLELFSQEQRPLSSREIAGTLGIPRSTINVVLRALIAEGYVRFDEAESLYSPTLKVALLGMWLAEGRLAAPRLRALVQLLAERTGETVSLWARSGLGARILLVRDSPRPVALKLAVGDSAPLFGSGVGLALLAALPDPEVLALLRQHNAAADEAARQDPATLMAEIQRVRADGFVAAYGRWLPEAGAVAAAIAEPPGSEPLAIAVGGPAVRIQPREALIVAALREALGEVRLAA